MHLAALVSLSYDVPLAPLELQPTPSHIVVDDVQHVDAPVVHAVDAVL